MCGQILNNKNITNKQEINDYLENFNEYSNISFCKRWNLEKENNKGNFKFLIFLLEKTDIDKYYKKFIFDGGDSYKTLGDKINIHIKEIDEFKNFIGINNDLSEKHIRIKTELLYGLLMKYINDNLFQNNNSVKLIDDVIKDLKQSINNCEKDDDIAKIYYAHIHNNPRKFPINFSTIKYLLSNYNYRPDIVSFIKDLSKNKNFLDLFVEFYEYIMNTKIHNDGRILLFLANYHNKYKTKQGVLCGYSYKLPPLFELRYKISYHRNKMQTVFNDIKKNEKILTLRNF